MKIRIMNKHRLNLALTVCSAVAPLAAHAQLVISDTLTGAASSYNWKSVNGACLTAGGSTTISATNPIPACVGLPYYSGKTLVGGINGTLGTSGDPVGQGALRLTNGDTASGGSNGNSQTGAVVSNFTFPSSQGMQVTFTTVTYGGNGGTGADGITFFLADGSQPVSVGSYGGSLGYSCANYKNPADGVLGGYIGVGIDEFGNFTNGATTSYTTTTASGTSSVPTTTVVTTVTDSKGVITSGPTTTTTVGSATVTSGNSTTSAATTVTNTPPNNTTTTTASGATTTTTSNPSTTTTTSSGKTTTKVTTVTTNTTPVTTVGTNFTITQNDNTASGPGQKPGSISLRGAGNVNWTWLNANYPSLYPSTSNSQQAAVQNTCKTGFLYNASGAAQTINGTTIPAGQYGPTVADYPLMYTSLLPKTTPIANQQATSTPTRGKAIPISYSLSITQAGLLNLSYSYNGGTTVSVIKDQSISESNGAVPANFRFGFSAGTGGSSNVHEITCFKAAQINVASTSAGVNVQQSARVEAGSQVYLAYYHPTNWWGQLTAANLVYTAASDTVSINSVANWDASCVLTGGTCVATNGSNTAQTTGSRQLLTWSGSAGIPLQWGNLSTAQQNTLDNGDTVANANRLGYLRGDRTNEVSNAGSFRTRNSVLGDIVDSSPAWVGAPSLSYKGPWKDALYPTGTQPEGTSYATFSATNATRTNVVYVGANDGLLHGFRAGAYTASGTFNAAALNDGQELLGYMPSSVLNTIHNTSPATALVDFSSPSYSHALFVDSTPSTGDLYYSGAWHTWLVGGLGAGGNASGPIGDSLTTATGGTIYALDITNPGNFSEANASSLVIGDWWPAGATAGAAGAKGFGACTSTTSTTTTAAKCDTNLGDTFGTPIIRRLHDGNWAVIFGNGLNSSTGTAGIYIMTVSQTGNISFRFLDTNYGPSKDPLKKSSKNGIAYVASADLDGDHITDYVYAGDAFGNLWRFDLTSKTSASWAAGTAPLFSTPASASTSQPITTRVTVTSQLSSNGLARVVVDFGTGQQFPQTLTSAATYASGAQALYGIWDWNMSGWNALSLIKYQSLSAPQTVTNSSLQGQTATNVGGGNGNISGYRTVTQNAICWKGSSVCAGGSTKNSQFGWTIALPDAGEQIIYNPTSAYGQFVVNTTIPNVNQLLSCNTQPPSGFTMAVASDTGGGASTSFFATATNNFVSSNGAIVSGIGLSAVGTPNFVSAMTKPYMINQTATGVGSATQVNAGAPGIGTRMNWIKLR